MRQEEFHSSLSAASNSMRKIMQASAGHHSLPCTRRGTHGVLSTMGRSIRWIVAGLALLLLITEAAGSAAKDGHHLYASKTQIEQLKIGKNTFESVKNLHYNWYIHSVKALLVQMAKELVPKLDKDSERQFLLCLNRIPVKTDIIRASQCLIRAKHILDNPPIKASSGEYKGLAAFVQEGKDNFDDEEEVVVTTPAAAFVTEASARKHRRKKTERNDHSDMAEEEYDRKRAEEGSRRDGERERGRERERDGERERVRERELGEEEMKRRKEKEGLFKRQHMKYWSPSKSAIPELKEVHSRWKRSEYRLTDRNGKTPEYSKVKTLSQAPSLLSSQKSAVQQISRAIMDAVRGKDAVAPPKWSETYNNLVHIKKSLDNDSKGPGARVYDLPMDELVFPNETVSSSSKSLRRSKSLMDGVEVPPIVQDAFKLADTIRGHSPSNKQDVNYKLLSPRFAPVMPDKYESRGVLSPSILSFYKDDREDQIASIPSLLEATGMNDKDRESMLEMIMEVSGAREIANEAFKSLNKLKGFGLDGELTEATKRIQKTFEDLERGFSGRQKAQMKKRGFSFLEKDQLHDLYEKQGVKPEHHEDFDLEEYGTLGHKEREAALWKRVEQFAANETSDNQHTRHRRALGQTSFTPTVLAPYMFSPVLGLVILGPTVLSPSLFSPLILNPAMLSPYVFSPAVGMPFLVSPYFLSPYVLSPLVFAPFVLNPYVLAPNVLNPYVLSPLILSPLVLCPDVISPMTLGGAILSPSVASPNILSKSTLMASVLSPSIFS